MTVLNRREFLLLGASSFLLSQCQRNHVVGIEASRNSQQVYRSQNGELNVDLEASHHLVQIGNQTLNLMTYNGQLPGPRLEAYPGDQVRIQFRNLLSEPTNLHFHGLHIPPTDQADNVFRKVAPGETVQYNFAIPNPHPGTFAYYHPHFHGSVANQILGGLGGIFIIRNELDRIPEIQASQEIFLFLKDFAGQTDRWMTGLMAGREGEVITVNGRLQPDFSIAKGEMVRLRLVNGSNAKFYRLALAEHSLFVIATDGYSLPQPIEQAEVLLSPGERVDILVQGQYDSGDYSLLNLPYDRGRMGMMGGSRTTQSQTIATLTYQGTQESQSLPTQLVPRQTLARATIERNFALDHGTVPGQGMQFLINGQSCNPRRHWRAYRGAGRCIRRGVAI